MLEGVGWEGQVQVEYLAEQGLDLSKERRAWKASEANLIVKDDLGVYIRIFASIL